MKRAAIRRKTTEVMCIMRSESEEEKNTDRQGKAAWEKMEGTRRKQARRIF